MASVQSMHGQGPSHAPAPTQQPPSSDEAGLPALNGHKRKHDDELSAAFPDAVKMSPQDNASMQLSGDSPAFGDSLDPSVEAFAISETKRRAQNRAAQRAFRERKERHLRELESRLAELESESRSWKSTNMALRSQLSMLEEELQHYRYSQPGDPQPGPPPHLQQAPPPQGPIPIQPPPAHGADPARNMPSQFAGPLQDFPEPFASGGMPPVPTQQQPQPQPQQPQAQQQAPQQAQYSQQPGMAPLNSPGSLSNPGLSYDSPSSGSSVPTRADDFCDRLSTACGTRDHPVPDANAPRISSETAGWQQDAMFGNIADWVQNDNWNFRDKQLSQTPQPTSQATQQQPVQQDEATKPAQNPELSPMALNLDFGNIATGFGPFNLNGGDGLNFDGLLGNEFGVFDPLDDMLEWQPRPQQEQQPKQPEQPAQPQQQQQPEQPQQQSQQQPQQSQQQPEVQKDGVEVPVASQKFIPCADVWDRICSHPRFGEIDINSMCQELRNKARCSKRGVVLNEQDVDQVLGSLR